MAARMNLPKTVGDRQNRTVFPTVFPGAEHAPALYGAVDAESSAAGCAHRRLSQSQKCLCQRRVALSALQLADGAHELWIYPGGGEELEVGADEAALLEHAAVFEGELPPAVL